MTKIFSELWGVQSMTECVKEKPKEHKAMSLFFSSKLGSLWCLSSF